ncbi:type II toxin-antitoxin system VapC family toxin [Endothiovibrio diazotrophicus]
MIVIDVNVVIYLLTDTPHRALAVRLYERDDEWRLPSLWRHEMINVLGTLTRNEVLDLGAATQLWRNALDLFAAGELQPDMEQALSLAVDRGISVYDAQYVTLAMALDTRLVSEDRKLRQRLPERVVSMGQLVGND